jgi:hypothetical protein
MGKNTLGSILPEKKCRKCGKMFIPAPLHVYREYSKYYCSWTCYLHRKDKETDTHDKRTT